MTRIDSIVRKAARRVTAQRALRSSGAGFVIGAVVAIAALALDRLGMIHSSWWMYAASCAAGALAGAVSALFVHVAPLTIAARLDRAMHLHDRLGSALAARSKVFMNEDDPQRAFAELTALDADRAAERVDVSRAVPLRYPGVWNVAAILSMALVLGIGLLPRVAATDPAAIIAGNDQTQRRQQATQDLSQSIDQALTQLERDALAEDAGAAEHVDALRDLQRQLAGESVTERELSEAQQQTAARMNALSERMQQQAERDKRAIEELAKRFDSLQTADAPPTTRELLDELRSGNYQNAADRLERLINEAQQLEQQQRMEAADSLREASETINGAAENNDGANQNNDEYIDRALRDEGLDATSTDDVKRQMETASQRELTDELIEKGVEEERARRIAEQMHQQQQQRQSEKQSNEQAEQVRDALQRAADELEQKRSESDSSEQSTEKSEQSSADENTRRSATSQSSEQSQPNQSQEQQSHSGAQREEQSASKDQSGKSAETGGEKSESASSAQQPSQPDSDTGDKSDDASPAATGESGDERAGREQAENPASERYGEDAAAKGAADDTLKPKPDASKQGSAEGAKTRQQSQESSGDQSARQETARPPGETQAEREKSNNTNDGDGEPIQQPGQTDPDASNDKKNQRSERPSQANGADDSQQPTEPPSPSEVLRELAKRRDAADRMNDASEEMRQQAREMAERMSPEQQQRWAKQFAREMQKQRQGDGGAMSQNPGDAADGNTSSEPSSYKPQRTETVDARGPEKEAGLLLDEWLSEQELPATDRTGSAQPVGDAVRSAREVAQRAVNDSSVPRRYHQLIEQYFGRLNETVRDATQPRGDNSVIDESQPGGTDGQP